MLCWCFEDGQDKEDSKFHSTLLRAGLRINKSVVYIAGENIH